MKPVEQDDEKYLDPYAVFSDRRLKQYTDGVALMPDGDGAVIVRDGKTVNGRHRVIIDVEHYQRGATSEVESIAATLRAGGIIPAVKSAVLRKNGDIAIIDGGQTWRAAVQTRSVMSVRLFEFDDVELEANLFYLLNRVRAVTSDIRIRSCSAASAAFLRDVNDEKLTKNLFWKPTGETSVSATAILKAFAEMFTDAQAVGTDISKVLEALDQPSALGTKDRANRSNRDKAREFLLELLVAFKTRRPTIVEIVAMGSVKRTRGMRAFSKKALATIGKETKARATTLERIKELSRAKRIEMLAGIYLTQIGNL
jgi:hypothetical protein